jgi:hypothetical protein
MSSNNIFTSVEYSFARSFFIGPACPSFNPIYLNLLTLSLCFNTFIDDLQHSHFFLNIHPNALHTRKEKTKRKENKLKRKAGNNSDLEAAARTATTVL